MTAFQDSPPPLPDPMFRPEPARSAWPKVIGIISICLAGLGLICLPIIAGITMYADKIYRYYPAWYRQVSTLLMVIAIPLAVLHLVGGILLLKRRPVARLLLMIIGVAGVLAAIVNIIIFSNVDTGMMPAAQAMSFKMSSIFSIPFGAAYPVFLLAWFSRGRIRQEVNSWKAARGQL
jgi:predicted lysophospholipase L1 biosynthesis ABC-type transport system permease subunit